MMLSVTDAASAHFAQLLSKAGKPDEEAVRLEWGTSDQLTLRFDYIQPDDTTVDYLQRTVLVLSPEVSQALSGSTIGVEETEEGPKLVIRR